MGHMATVFEHSNVEELEGRYVGCQDATTSRHFQVIWLLARIRCHPLNRGQRMGTGQDFGRLVYPLRLKNWQEGVNNAA